MPITVPRRGSPRLDARSAQRRVYVLRETWLPCLRRNLRTRATTWGRPYSVSNLEPIQSWFTKRGWTPLPFQEETWQAYLEGHSGLVQVPTGSGKTLAAVLGPVAEMLRSTTPGLKLLYLTPLRAVGRDIEKALAALLADLAPHLRVESRTGDSSASVKKRQLKGLPDILITTPESLSVMLSYKGSGKLFAHLNAVVVDEWHELLSTKRGTQTELCLARLRFLRPSLRTWALSASIANLGEAAQAASGAARPVIIQSDIKRETLIRSVLPESITTFPRAGQLGSAMVLPLLRELDIERSTLIFTNTRRQAERWYQLLLEGVWDYADKLALHHGSIDRKERERIEEGVKTGAIKWVVATSSLDLGVDFQPVERVVQIGSPKSVARVVQRAGRSAHAPGGVSELLFVPTNALELLEIAAARAGLAAGAVEARSPLDKPYDVLAQHLITLACGDGFTRDEVLNEVKTAAAYKHLTEQELDDILNLIEHGGRSLRAYPDYHKVTQIEGRYKAASTKAARRHRMSIGTITSGSVVQLKYTNRRFVGTVDEQFASRLKRGDVFLFGGRRLEFLMMQGMTAIVRNAKSNTLATPSWSGASLPLSSNLSNYLRQTLENAHNDLSAELTALRPLLERQAEVSGLPKNGELLLERTRTREGEHLYVYPFEGSHVHGGLAALWALRMARLSSTTFSYAVNDYGIEFVAPKGYAFDEVFGQTLFEVEGLEADIRESVNLAELAKRQFRGVAQVAGLVFKGYPGSKKTGRQLQTSTSVLYEVFREYEPESVLIRQAEREVLAAFGQARLLEVLARLRGVAFVHQKVKKPTPLGFPLYVERLRSRLSTESLAERVERMVAQWAHV